MGTCLRAVPLAMLLLAAAWLARPAWSSPPPVTPDQGPATQGQEIHTAQAPADSNPVTARVVDEWQGTLFRFDANSTPRPLTEQDVRNLRAKGFGYGEISILLALTANQPHPATAKPLNEILTQRRAGKGWGELARELGYKNLGSALRDRPERTERLERSERAKKPEKGGRTERPQRGERPARVEGAERPEKLDRIEKPERTERPERVERRDREERRDRDGSNRGKD